MSQDPGRAKVEPLIILFIAMAVLWLWPLALNPSGVVFAPNAQYSDLLISHLPNALFIHKSLLTWHQVPLWNPDILSGMPVSGDPLAGLWYPPLWLAILLPLPVTFNLLAAFHLAFGGWGAWCLARREGADQWGSVAAAAVFSGTPALIGHFALGHITLLMAVCWTPWLLVAVHRAVHALMGDDGSWGAWAGTTGAILGVVFLADPRWSVPAGLLAGAMGVRLLIGQGPPRELGRRALKAGGVAAAVSGSVAGVLWLPLYQLAALSTRSSLTTADVLTLSLPPARLLSLFVPDMGGYPEWTVYLGLGSLALAITAVVLRRPGAGFWGGLAVGGWLLAVGGATPVYVLAARVVPGLSMLRVPPRFLMLSALAVAVLAGKGLTGLYASDRLLRPEDIRRVSLVGFGWLTLGVLALLASQLMGGSASTSRDLAVAGAFGGTFGVILFLQRWSTTPPRIQAWLWIGIMAVELAVVGGSLQQVKPSSTSANLPASLETITPTADGIFRVFSPSYAVPQRAAAAAGLELADGVNPLQLRSYWEEMASATGFNASTYSVTLPPFPAGDPGQPWGAKLDAAKLGRLNIKYVVSSYPLDVVGLKQIIVGPDDVYLNQQARPRAWVESPASGSGSAYAPVEKLVWTPNHIVIQATGPGRLVLSEVAYPGWQVTVDGVRTSIMTTSAGLRAVSLDGGPHEVRFKFVPWPLVAGGGLSLLGCALLAWLWWKR